MYAGRSRGRLPRGRRAEPFGAESCASRFERSVQLGVGHVAPVAAMITAGFVSVARGVHRRVVLGSSPAQGTGHCRLRERLERGDRSRPRFHGMITTRSTPRSSRRSRSSAVGRGKRTVMSNGRSHHAARAAPARSWPVPRSPPTSVATPPEIQPSPNVRRVRARRRSRRRAGSAGAVRSPVVVRSSPRRSRSDARGTTAGAVQRARRISMHSSSRENRRRGSSPSAVNSSWSHPAPTPSTTRPPERTSSDVTARAVTNGCRSAST